MFAARITIAALLRELARQFLKSFALRVGLRGRIHGRFVNRGLRFRLGCRLRFLRWDLYGGPGFAWCRVPLNVVYPRRVHSLPKVRGICWFVRLERLWC